MVGDMQEIIETRFGRIAISKDNPIKFPQGLLGMPDKGNFFLTEFPSEKLEKFKLLQSLDDYALSFITLPIDLNNEIIALEDLALACGDVGIKVENLAVLLVVSVHRTPDKVNISVNARAPLLIDASQRLALQYVFKNDKYNVQKYISL